MPRRVPAPQRFLTTVMFTDIVGSTKLAAELGDRRWRHLLTRHHAMVRRALKRHGGRELDTAGDGFFASFDQPGRAISCAVELTRSLRGIGIEIRAGIHMGEVEMMGPTIGGIAVHVGSRVMSMAGPSEVWVSGTVRDLIAGSDVRFEDRGVHELKGVPAEWRLYSVQAESSAEALREETVEAAPERRPRIARHLPLPAIIVLAVVAATAVGAIFVLRDGAGLAVPGPNTLVQIDPGTGETLGVGRVGTEPGAVTYGLGSIWVANFADRTVQPVDPSTGEPEAPIGLTAAGNPEGIVTGDGFVWVTSSIDGVVFQIDPTTRGTRDIDVGVGVRGIAFGEHVVWVTNAQTNEVLRIDPATERIDRLRLEGDSQPTGIAVGGGSVWVAEHLKGQVTRIDPETLEVVDTVPLLRGRPDHVTFGGGFVWATVGSHDSLLRIDPAGGRGTTIENVGNQPAGVAVGANGVWVANSLDGTVVRVDPQVARVAQRSKLGFSPQGVAVSPEGVWVTLSA